AARQMNRHFLRARALAHVGESDVKLRGERVQTAELRLGLAVGRAGRERQHRDAAPCAVQRNADAVVQSRRARLVEYQPLLDLEIEPLLKPGSEERARDRRRQRDDRIDVCIATREEMCAPWL